MSSRHFFEVGTWELQWGGDEETGSLSQSQDLTIKKLTTEGPNAAPAPKLPPSSQHQFGLRNVITGRVVQSKKFFLTYADPPPPPHLKTNGRSVKIPLIKQDFPLYVAFRGVRKKRKILSIYPFPLCSSYRRNGTINLPLPFHRLKKVGKTLPTVAPGGSGLNMFL